MFSLFKKKLLLKFGLIFLTVIITAGGFSISYFSYKNSNNLIKNLEIYTTSLLKLAKNTYAVPLNDLNIEAVETITKSILDNKMIVAVNVYTLNKLYYGLLKDAQDSITEQQKPFKNNDPNVKVLTTDIAYKNIVIGQIELFYTVKSVNEEIINQTYQYMVFFIVIFLLMLGYIFFSIKKQIINPIINLAQVSQKIAIEHDYNIKLKSPSKDEIGVLYNVFSIMLTNIACRENDLKLRDDEIRKVKSYLSNIIESMPSMLITVDEKGMVTQWNQAAVNYTGIQSVDIIGKNILDAMPAFTEYMQRSEEILKSRQPQHFYRSHLNNDPHNFNNISLYPLVANGVKGMVVRVDDITELEEKEDQLRQIQKMETIGTLVGGLAHDFNNVLGGIVGTLSVLNFKIKKGHIIELPELQKHLSVMDESGQRAVDMIAQLMSISRKQELSLTRVDLNSSIKHVMKICQNTIDKSVEFILQIPDEPTMIFADPTQMEQVILNLCVNASHAMTIMRKPEEKQGGKLTLNIDKITADKHFCKAHPDSEEINYWRFTVSDTGIGMEQRIISKIFEPFFTTKEKGKGTGLGLAMVYNIIIQHKGFIDVYSEVGLGTTFNVYLPELKQGDIASQQIEEELSVEGEGLILIIDDEETMRNLATIMLKECGYSTVCAVNGLEGLEEYKKHMKDIRLVLLDMVMPKMSGKEAFIELKKIKPDVKVLLASGFRQDERVQDVLNLGCNGFIQKPYSLIKLSKKIDEILKQI